MHHHAFRPNIFLKTCSFLLNYPIVIVFIYSVTDDDDELDPQWSTVQLFLIASGLREYASRFISEQIDLDALVLLSDEDLKSLGLPLGPRKKLLRAIDQRRAALENPGEVLDSRL